MAQVTWSAEGGTNSVGITTGNSGGDSGDAFESVSLGAGATAVYDNTQARGTLAAKLATGGSPADCSLNYGTAIGAQTQLWYRTSVYMTANPASSHRLIDSWDSGSGQLCFAIYLTSAGKLMSVNTAGSTIQTTTASVNLNGWFRVEAMLIGNATTGQVEVKLFNNPDSSTPTETITSTANQNTRGSANNYRFGAAGDPLPAGRTLWLDDLGISTTGYLGPTGSAVTLTPAAGAWSAVGVTPVPQPVAVTLTAATGAWSAAAATPVPQPVTVSLTAAAATWSATVVTPAPGDVTVPLTPAIAAWAAEPSTPVPQPVTVPLLPAAAVLAAQPLTLAPLPPTVALTAASAAWSAAAVTVGDGIVRRPVAGVIARPNSGLVFRP